MPRILRHAIRVRTGSGAGLLNPILLTLGKVSPLWTSCFLSVEGSQYIPAKILCKDVCLLFQVFKDQRHSYMQPTTWLVQLKESGMSEATSGREDMYLKNERYWVRWKGEVDDDGGLPVVYPIHPA